MVFDEDGQAQDPLAQLSIPDDSRCDCLQSVSRPCHAYADTTHKFPLS